LIAALDSPSFPPGQQCDATEFITLLCDSIIDSKFQGSFVGTMTAELTCSLCRAMHAHNETHSDALKRRSAPFTCFPVYLPLNRASTTLSTLLEEESGVETVEVSCPALCTENKELKVRKRLLTLKLPSYFFLVFSRYTFDKKRLIASRNNMSIEYPSSMIFKVYESKAPIAVTKSLQAVICHQGQSASQGHYTMYRKDGTSWYHFDDSRVRLVPQSEVLAQRVGAYLLCYGDPPTTERS